MKYKVGDRVRVRAWKDMVGEFGTDSYGAIKVPCSFMPEMKQFCGRTVTIRRVIAGDAYRIKEDDYGWSFSSGMFEDPKTSKAPKTPKVHKPIVIYQEGRKVIAQDTQTGKTGVARCHPDDKFDFYYGAGLAIERLTGYKPEPEPKPVATRKPKYYSGKVVCVKNFSCFTEGKVYTIKDGTMYNDIGDSFDSIEDIDWLNNHFNSQFIKFVG